MNQSYSAWKEKCGRKIKYNQLVEKGKTLMFQHVSCLVPKYLGTPNKKKLRPFDKFLMILELLHQIILFKN